MPKWNSEGFSVVAFLVFQPACLILVIYYIKPGLLKQKVLALQSCIALCRLCVDPILFCVDPVQVLIALCRLCVARNCPVQILCSLDLLCVDSVQIWIALCRLCVDNKLFCVNSMQMCIALCQSPCRIDFKISTSNDRQRL